MFSGGLFFWADEKNYCELISRRQAEGWRRWCRHTLLVVTVVFMSKEQPLSKDRGLVVGLCMAGFRVVNI